MTEGVGREGDHQDDGGLRALPVEDPQRHHKEQHRHRREHRSVTTQGEPECVRSCHGQRDPERQLGVRAQLGCHPDRPEKYRDRHVGRQPGADHGSRR
jgi:hypothetical protein